MKKLEAEGFEIIDSFASFASWSSLSAFFFLSFLMTSISGEPKCSPLILVASILFSIFGSLNRLAAQLVEEELHQ